MRAISVRQLEVFCETAAAGNLTRAAAKLYMTQAAASMALAQLEKEAGGPVFTRLGRGLRLNDRGIRLLPLAERTLADYDHLQGACRDSGPLSGTVRVGASTTIANYCFPGLCGEFMRLHDQVMIKLRVGNTDEMASALRRGEVDFAVVEGPVAGDDIAGHDWLRDELVIVTAPRHKLAGKHTVKLNSLMKDRWVLREKGSGTLNVLEKALTKNGLRVENAQEIGHTEAIKRAVEAGMGISCLSYRAVSREAAAGELAALKVSPPLFRWFKLLNYKGRYQSREAKAFSGWLRSARDPQPPLRSNPSVK